MKNLLIDALTNILIELLKLETMGGIRAWLLKKLVNAFSKEVVEIVSDITDYIVTNKEIDNANSQEDRDIAVDRLNDAIK